MAKYIEKLLLHNFCRFKDIEIQFNAERNILIGDNEAGKSTILNALDIVLSGSFRKVETHGLDRLFNKETIDEFLTSGRRYDEFQKCI